MLKTHASSKYLRFIWIHLVKYIFPDRLNKQSICDQMSNISTYIEAYIYVANDIVFCRLPP